MRSLDEVWFLVRLIESLRLLAAGYETQVSALPSFVDVPDELALTLDECWVLVPQVQEVGLLNEEGFEKLPAIDAHLERMSSDKSPWTLDAVRSRPKWVQARRLAIKGLVSLGQDVRPPDLTWVTHIGKAADQSNRD